MALSATTIWEVRTTGSDSICSAGFNPGNSNFATDGAATSATGSSPVFSSASYTFVAGDVNAYVFIKSGTNWTPGWYQIASVSAGAATLTASVGSAILWNGNVNVVGSGLNTVAGCATTASPTSATWGIDYSQQAAAQIAFTDMVIDGTTNTKFTSAGNPVGKNFVGNLIKVTSGTGFTVQTVEVVSTSGTTATCDKSLGTLSSTGGNGYLGGCFASLANLNGIMVDSNFAYVKNGTYNLTSGLSFSTNHATSYQTTILGYNSNRTDNPTGSLRPTIATNGNAIVCVTIGGAGWAFRNFILDCSGATKGTQGLNFSSNLGSISNIKALNSSGEGLITNQANCSISDIEVTGCAGTNAAIFFSTNVTARRLFSHDNSKPGIYFGNNGSGTAINCVSANNTGASSDGFVMNYGATLQGCVSYGNGRDGIRILSGALNQAGGIENCILVSNTGYGISVQSTLSDNAPAQFNHNAFYNNTSGARSGLVAGVGDVTLTGSPFINVSSNNFALNNTAGAGAACRAAGIGGVTTFGTGYSDIGALQSRVPWQTSGLQGGLSG